MHVSPGFKIDYIFGELSKPAAIPFQPEASASKLTWGTSRRCRIGYIDGRPHFLCYNPC
jgi:hypothetical protein